MKNKTKPKPAKPSVCDVLDEQLSKLAMAYLEREKRTSEQLTEMARRLESVDEKYARIVRYMSQLVHYIDKRAQTVLEDSIRRDIKAPVLSDVAANIIEERWYRPVGDERERTAWYFGHIKGFLVGGVIYLDQASVDAWHMRIKPRG